VVQDAQVMHVFAYVGSEGVKANNKSSDFQEQNEARSFLVNTGDQDGSSADRSFRLRPGERRGWWSMYQQPAGKVGIATVHGAVCDHRVNILLDSGSSTSMISLDLARKLGLKLSFNERLKVTGVGGVVTFVTAKAAAKVTLGLGIIYYLDLWAGNIGEGIDCLLGFDFMVRAGVRLCANDGSVRLPDEERVPLAASGFRPKLPERISVNTQRELYVPQGRSCTVPIIYGRHRALELEVWASRHDSWVTTIVHDPDGCPECVRITNVSPKPLVIPP
jgi:hypothetical protein